MKLFALVFLIFFSATYSVAQENSKQSEKHFGLALNSFVIGRAELVFIAPGISYYQNKHAFELGAGFGIVARDYDRSISSNLNYKFFPFGIRKRINAYAAVDLNYFNLLDESFPGSNGGNSEIRVNQVSILGGVGAQLKLWENAYFGIGFYMGATTSQMIYSYYYNPNDKERLFEKYVLDGLLKVSVGYRF